MFVKKEYWKPIDLKTCDISLHDGVPKRFYTIRDKEFGDWEIPPWELFIYENELLGEGSFSKVYLAKWRETLVVAKVLDENICKQKKELVLREFNTMTKLHHPNIVQFLGYIDNPFILIMEYELTQQSYNKIFVLSDRMEFIHKIKERFGKEYRILSYMKENNPTDNQRFKDVALTVEKIKKTKGLYDLMKLEDELKRKSKINRVVLKNNLINSLILSKCNLVLKTDGMISGFSKILNPSLRMYRVNGVALNIWPESYITLYADTNIRSQVVRKILRNRGNKELKKSLKDKYNDLLI